jgi:hypothetical protein
MVPIIQACTALYGLALFIRVDIRVKLCSLSTTAGVLPFTTSWILEVDELVGVSFITTI